MADKTVKELAAMTTTTVEAINNQLVKAGLSARGDNDIVTDSEQQKLVSFLQQSHGQNDKPRISLKAKLLLLRVSQALLVKPKVSMLKCAKNGI